MIPLELYRVVPCTCGCGTHALALLRNRVNGDYMAVRVDCSTGRILNAALAGLTDEDHAKIAKLMEAILAAMGCNVEYVAMTPECPSGSAFVRLKVESRSREVPVSPCNALLISSLLKASLYDLGDGRPPIATEVPVVFHPFLETLDLDVLDRTTD